MTDARRSTALLLAPLALLAACSTPPRPWTTDVVAELGRKLGGCAVGDVDERHAGAEIVAVDVDGRVYVAHRDASGAWHDEVAVQLTGEAIQCAIGDVLPAHDGLEIVTVGKLEGDEDSPGPGAVHVVHRSGEGWVARRVFDDDALVHAIDIVPGDDGDAVLVAGYTDIAYLLRADGDAMTSEALADVGGDAKAALWIDDDRMAVGCATGALVLLERDGDAWTTRTIHQAPSSQARLARGPDGSVLACRNDGALALVTTDGDVATLHRESGRLRGAVAADLEPEREGLELATTGYSGNITLLRRGDDGWQTETIPADDDRLHHLAVGEVDGLGPVLVACGYGGRLVVAHR